MNLQPFKILIKGAGEQSSGTAHRLFRCGFRVAMTDLAWPQAVRRTVSFCSAIFDREIVVEGVRAVAYSLDDADILLASRASADRSAPALNLKSKIQNPKSPAAVPSAFDWTHIPVFVDPDCRLKDLWRPDVIIDGRVLKRNLDNHVGDAPLVIGYGPGLLAGQDVDFVVETNRGHDLGRIIAAGTAAADTGIPGDIAGFTDQRVLRSPADGTLQTQRRIGEMVNAADVIATVADQRIIAAIPGVLRGLAYPGLPVVVNQKVGDIDPRCDPTYCYTLSDKARTLSGAALEIILSFLQTRSGTPLPLREGPGEG